MSEHLANVTYLGRKTAMPGLPDRNIKGALWVEEDMLVFYSNGEAIFAIPLDQINNVDAGWYDPTDLASAFMRLVSVYTFTPKDWCVTIKWLYPEMSVYLFARFLVGNTSSQPFFVSYERQAMRLTKTIWTLRGEAKNKVREQTTIRYR